MWNRSAKVGPRKLPGESSDLLPTLSIGGTSSGYFVALRAVAGRLQVALTVLAQKARVEVLVTVGGDHGSGPPTQRHRSSEADVSHIK